jgi:heavy metal sensor kinase
VKPVRFVSLPIRTRLTAWYAGVLLATLLVFGALAQVAVRAAIAGSIDADLETRLAGLENFLQVQMSRGPSSRLPHQFDEHAALRPGGEMMQICDSSGNWVFQSESIRTLGLNARGSTPPDRPLTEVLRGVPIRLRSAVITMKGEVFYVQLASTMGAAYGALDRFRWLILALIPLMVCAAGIGGYWVSTRALAPVGAIITDARSIGLQNISRRLVVPATGDELQVLSETLNEMIQRLESACRRMTQFTADASHELRTPVALIRTTAEVALLQPRDGESYRGALKDILAEGERTTKLIEDLLVLSRADSGAFQLNAVPIDLKEPLQEAWWQGVTLAAGKNVRLTTNLPDAAVAVLGDAGALRRMFLILIDNAIKYTPIDGSVAVKLAATDLETVFTVQDSGIGIAAEELEHIFERFYRADKARQRDSGGAGLGLSIARWIAEAHRARIHVESGPNSGSKFSVRFPKLS